MLRLRRRSPALVANQRRACRAPIADDDVGRNHRRQQAQLHFRSGRTLRPAAPIAMSQQATRPHAAAEGRALNARDGRFGSSSSARIRRARASESLAVFPPGGGHAAHPVERSAPAEKRGAVGRSAPARARRIGRDPLRGGQIGDEGGIEGVVQFRPVANAGVGDARPWFAALCSVAHRGPRWFGV